MAPRKTKKQPRRKPGTGAIRFKKGRSLPYEAEFKLNDGQSRYDYFATTIEAAAHLDRLVADRDSKETPRNIEKGSQSATHFLEAWLAIKSAHVEEKTLQDYTYQCNLAIDKIGRYRIDSIDLMMADTMLAAFAKEGYKNVAQMRMVMNQAFEYAEDNDYIKKNPFRKSTAPRTKHRKAQAITEKQRAILLECARVENGMPLEPLWHLCSRLAFRRGEALGLRWSDIDFVHGIITLTQQRTTVGTKTITKGALKGDKDGDKVRLVPVPDDILGMFGRFKQAQIKRAANDPDWVVTGFVFVGEHGQPPVAYTVNRRLNDLVKRVNKLDLDEDGKPKPTAILLPTDLTPHSLRHTSLTILALSGVPANVRKRLSGHSTAKMDELYTSHADLEDVRKALGG